MSTVAGDALSPAAVSDETGRKQFLLLPCVCQGTSRRCCCLEDMFAKQAVRTVTCSSRQTSRIACRLTICVATVCKPMSGIKHECFCFLQIHRMNRTRDLMSRSVSCSHWPACMSVRHASPALSSSDAPVAYLLTGS